jgi:hypothetical protein
MANVFESGPFAARATSGDASHARTPGMVNPLKMGLLGGLQGYLQGVAQDQTMTRKYQQQASIEEMKARNNRLIKMLETDAQQRAYTVHQVGDDGKVYDVSMRNTYNPQSGKYEPTEISRAPAKDPLAATNALIASREKIAGQQIGAANSRSAASISAENARNAARIAAKNDPSVETAAERRNRLLQIEENRRAANKATEADVRAYSKADPDTRAQMLKDAGINVDPGKDPAAAMKAYRAAMSQQHHADYDSEHAPEPGESTAHPDKTPKGQPIKYDGEGNAYIKGPDGKPVPYDPAADASSTGSGLALDSDEAQALAQDHAPADTEAQQDDAGDGQEQGLLASADQEPHDDTETESEYQRGMSPAGYPPQGPLTSEDDEGGILA